MSPYHIPKVHRLRTGTDVLEGGVGGDELGVEDCRPIVVSVPSLGRWVPRPLSTLGGVEAETHKHLYSVHSFALLYRPTMVFGPRPAPQAALPSGDRSTHVGSRDGLRSRVPAPRHRLTDNPKP